MSTITFIIYEFGLFILIQLLLHRLSKIMYENAVKEAIETFARKLASMR